MLPDVISNIDYEYDIYLVKKVELLFKNPFLSFKISYLNILIKIFVQTR